MNIFLAGASGLVGSAVAAAAARRGHRVTGTVGSFSGELEGVTKKIPLDLTDEAAANAAVLDAFPDAIVNCAAVADPASVEVDPARSQRLNVALPVVLAQAAHHLSARFVHLSSEQVFDGARETPYARTDTPSPVNLYGRQKVESERGVHAAAPAFAVTLRAPLLMGNSPGGKRSLHEKMLLDWSAGKTITLYADEYRQPCTAENLAEVIVEMCERRDLTGVYHWAGTELLSRCDLGVRLREHFRIPEKNAPIKSVTRAATPDVAKKRPGRLALDLAPLPGVLKTKPESVADQLAKMKISPAVQAWYHGL